MQHVFVISSINSGGNSDEIRFIVSWITLQQNHANVFHLIWIMSLHYFVKLKMIVAHMLANSRIYPTSTVASKFARFDLVDYNMWGIAREGVQNTHHWSGDIDDATDEWLPQWRHDPCSLALSILSRCFSSSWSVMHVLYAFSCSIPTRCNQLLANLEATVEMG